MPNAQTPGSKTYAQRSKERRDRERTERAGRRKQGPHHEKQRAGDLDRLAARVYQERVNRGEVTPRRAALPDERTLAVRSLYALEKEKSEARNAARRADEIARIRDALARADHITFDAKANRRRLRPIKAKSNPADALLSAVEPYGFAV